jgi:hypothetical protein
MTTDDGANARRTAVAVATILVVQAAVALYLGLPGQLSYDSIIQLYEGRTLRFISYNPPLMSLLLGALDRIADAPIAFVVISLLLLSAATWLVLSSARRPSAPRLAVAALLVLNPVILSYVGIVWKDVLFAHTTVLTFALLATWRRDGRRLTLALAMSIALLLFVIVGARQQGVLFAVPAAIWAATLVGGSKRARVLAAAALIAFPIAGNRAVDWKVASWRTDAAVNDTSTGLAMLMVYDLNGVVAAGGALPADTPPALAAELAAQSAGYSRFRIDTIIGPGPQFSALSRKAAARFWLTTIAANPLAYARHRVAHFTTLLGLDDMRRCLPVISGVSGPVLHADVAGNLNVLMHRPAGDNHASPLVNSFGWTMANTPLFMHLAYATVLLPVMVLLYRRGEAVWLTLAACSLVLLASYLAIGIACDFRYAYVLTVSASLITAFVVLNGRRDAAPARRTS